MKNKLLVSFSGGRTSGFMARWCQLNLSDKYEIIYVFANTGEEHEATLEFVNKCDKEFGLNVVWIEAEITKDKGKGTRHKVVTFETASRNGEPLEAIIEKYGIFNKAYPHCNRESKLQPIMSYRKSIGWRDCYSAVGIRADEIDRISKDQEKNQLIYPLIELYPVDKYQIFDWWSEQSFDLEIPEHYGNCKTCWKKSDRKLKTIAIENPEWFDFYARMEARFKNAFPERVEEGANKFFRQKRTVRDMLKASEKPFDTFIESSAKKQTTFFKVISAEDQSDGCEESCEAYGEVA